MSLRNRSLLAHSIRYEIYQDSEGWKWRFVDGKVMIGPMSRPLTWEQCLKTVQILRNTLAAPVLILR